MKVALDQVRWLGSDLNRAECVVAHRSGLLIVPDWTGSGGVALIWPDGRTRKILALHGGEPLRPNGIALEPGGSIVLAHLGAETGGIFRLGSNGSVEPLLEEIDGAALPPCNFVLADGAGGYWLTVSTRRQPRTLGYRGEVRDGFIAHFGLRGARIAAGELGYTNECAIDPSGRWLYANETFARRLSRFALEPGGRLGPRETVVEFGAGVFPDGLAFDAAGDAWITSIVSNRVLHLDADGRLTTVIDDSDPDHLASVEKAYQGGEMDGAHLEAVCSKKLRNISSLAFGGPGLRTAYLGCLLGSSIAAFPAPVAGHPLPHWDIDLGPLRS